MKDEIVLYQPNETIQLEVHLKDETVWLTQQQIADLFGVKQPAISKHIANIYKSGELDEEGTYSILEYMLKNRGRTVTAPELYEAVWKEKFLAGSGNTVMVHVLNLRRKIEETPSSPKIIRTVWGKGYQID